MLSVTQCLLADGFEGCATLKFDNVEVPVENVVGELNKGFRLVMTCEYHSRRRCLDLNGPRHDTTRNG